AQRRVLIQCPRGTPVASQEEREGSSEHLSSQELICVVASVGLSVIGPRELIEFITSITGPSGRYRSVVELLGELTFRTISLCKDSVGARKEKIVFAIDAIIDIPLIKGVPEIRW